MPGRLGELPPEREWTQSPLPTALSPWDPRLPPAGSAVVVPPFNGVRLEDLARELVWWSQAVPHQSPPFRALPLVLQRRVVLNAPSGDAAAVAGAAALVAAAGQVEAVVLLPAVALAVNVAEVVLTVEVARGQRARVHLLGAEVHDAASESVKFQLVVGGRPVTPEGDLASFSTLETPASTFALASAGQTIELRARNLDLHSAALVEAVLLGWAWPVVQQDDSLRSTLAGGFGPGETNGRFTRGVCPPVGGCP